MLEVEGNRNEANFLKEEIEKKVDNASDFKIQGKPATYKWHRT